MPEKMQAASQSWCRKTPNFPRRTRVFRRSVHSALLWTMCYWIVLFGAPCTRAQQTLGGITGEVTDKAAASVPGTTVTIVSDQTKLSRTQKTNDTGSYEFVSLPIGRPPM